MTPLESFFLFLPFSLMAQRRPSDEEPRAQDYDERQRAQREREEQCRTALPRLLQYYEGIRGDFVAFLKKHYLRPSDPEPEGHSRILRLLHEACSEPKIADRFRWVIGECARAHRGKIQRVLLANGQHRTLCSADLRVPKYRRFADIYSVYAEVSDDIPDYWEPHAQIGMPPARKGRYSVIELRHEDTRRWSEVLAAKALRPAGLRELTAWITLLGKEFGDDTGDCSAEWEDENPLYRLRKRTIAAPGDLFLDRCCAGKVIPSWSGYMHGAPRREKLYTIDARDIVSPILVREEEQQA